MFNFSSKRSISDVERPFRQFKAYNEAALNSHKTMGGPKPKGLSMRSSSDINVSHNTAPTNVKKNDSAQDFLKIKITQMDNKGYPISPGKEISTNKLIKQLAKCKESAVEDVIVDKSIKMQKVLEDAVFKKPLPPKRFIRRYAEPEKLANYYEDQHKFDYGYIEQIEKENLFLKEKEDTVVLEERKLESDSEILISPEIPRVIFPTFLDQEYIELSSPDLPKIF